ncbi:hypothetical protein EJ066_28420 [Mesorhizobium sp. M9A.F.Ca.ET.002.03.1.2]|uniref:hypothetical protein n=1 Tax=Mesorhizobium sp. M9A.F.Ca.ET.002.03.1.2 TaxID=2493668 RepID=UPI000F75676B|nr:hypothetical protein [Mesorhizobium sp. M9A.F.Ca.ET.002.03.1.2]AZO00713.1 hypothetical protein EJ066_28420 [Mesorhizobium sp. M9A.F.Ca.ET.002.03.1.2]
MPPRKCRTCASSTPRRGWIGHKLHADIAIAVEESLPVSEAKKITTALEDELFEHMPALAAANIRFASADADHRHEHVKRQAPDLHK